MRKYLIYIHITPSMKVYVGQTYMGNEENRWRKGEGYKSNKHFYYAIKKYGWDNIKHYILVDNVSSEDIDTLEREYIIKFDSYNQSYGYNLDIGGNTNKTHSESTKEKIRNTESGKQVTDETRVKLKNSHLGVSVNKGVPKSENHKQKLSESLRGKYIAEDCARSIPIIAIDKSTNQIVAEFANAKEAAKWLGNMKLYSHIRECCRGERKTCKGYVFQNKII